MSRPLSRAFLWGLLIAALVAVALAAAVSLFSRGTVALPPVLGEVGPFSLVDQAGEPVTAAALAGTPWVADLIFTRCAVSCPMMSARLAELDQDLPQRVRLVSVSVDPGHDTPKALAEYAARFGASERWRFLTGEMAQIERLAREGFKLALDPDPPPGTVSPDEPILHATRFVLVDGEGRIRGYYDPFEEGELARLRRELAVLL